MKGELKAGSLALIVKSEATEDVGKCVTLVKLVSPGQTFVAPDGIECYFRNEFEKSWVVIGDIYAGEFNGKKVFYGWAIYPPERLLPIDGDDDQAPEQLTKDKPAELTA